ncbi:MAG TPA: hypothetical protein VLA88_02120 [Candidatus Saccharimonadales bacterium]|nr:hypothetical protein [Candidatus Saccharimonadales bacterium]
MGKSTPNTGNKANTSKTKTTRLQAWVSIIAIAVGVLLLATPIWLYFKLDSRPSRDFAMVNNAMEEIRHKTMDPAGAVERTEVAAKSYDNFYDPFDCWDEICPNMQRSWFVPVEPGQERALLKRVLTDSGYSITDESTGANCQTTYLFPCHITGTKNGVEASVNANEIGPIKPPDRIITPKIWRYVLVRVQRAV